jgi:hypothetical protein
MLILLISYTNSTVEANDVVVSCIRCVVGSAVGRCSDCSGVSDGFPQLLDASCGI